MAKKETNRVNFHKQFQLHKACTSDELRPVMSNILFRNGYAYATDAFIAVKARLEDITNFPPDQIAMLDGHMLNRKHYEMLLKADYAEIGRVTNPETDEETVQIRVLCENSTFFILPLIKEQEGHRFPDCEKAIFKNSRGGVPVPAIGFNFTRLGALKAAMGIQANMQMHFSGNGKQIEIYSIDLEGYDVRGIIMAELIEN